ncbi:hypothetical protein DFP72DRAFT_1003204 [Ephemerocybe angulata]|uniref:Uncharacterized protein n=1 Tax=Ephemerocybe angulata TaxID=980116 RepID=A0A8H6MCZ8_9AGAR|nr:hypothetical protein DFP72DRAFT_1003204 [Tulosesus angulatus]
MANWTRLFYSSSATQVVAVTAKAGDDFQGGADVVEVSETVTTEYSPELEQNVGSPPLLALSRVRTTAVVSEQNKSAQGDHTKERPSLTSEPARRFSFKRISFSRKSPNSDNIPALSTLQEHDKRGHALEAAEKRQKEKEKLTKSALRAKKNALRVRMLITGEPTGSLPAVSPVVAKPQLNKIKSQLSEPKTANKLILELRRLPATSASSGSQSSKSNHDAPIHAVCLEFTEAEEEKVHFMRLSTSQGESGSIGNGEVATTAFPSFLSAPVDQLSSLLNDMHVVELMRSPDLGLGQPGDGEGVLAGAVPTPETVIRGVKEITPQLMALGYATGRAITPDHTGIYPPTDRISVLTYWWGLEVLLPPPTIDYLSRVQSITSAVVNFLSAMALVNNGVREILPFVRYIAQFIEFEFNTIKGQNRGKGVVCAATWIMPAALIPRPWDFPEGPPPPAVVPEEPAEEGEGEEVLPPLPPKPKSPAKKKSSAPSLPKPRPVSSILDIVSKPTSPVLSTESSPRVSQAATPPPPPLVPAQA